MARSDWTFEIYSKWVPAAVARVRDGIRRFEMVHKIQPYVRKMKKKKVVVRLGFQIYSKYYTPSLCRKRR